MLDVARCNLDAETRPILRIYRSEWDDPQVMSWSIDGQQVRLWLWTVEQWRSVAYRPDGARYHEKTRTWTYLQVGSDGPLDPTESSLESHLQRSGVRLEPEQTDVLQRMLMAN